MGKIKFFERRILCVLAISIVLSFIFASLMGGNLESVLEEYENYKEYGGVCAYSSSDLMAVNYMADNQKYVSLNNDPQLIISGVNRYVGSINISFAVPIVQDIPVEVFWGIEGEGFVQERMHPALVKKGEQELSIIVQEKVTDLRLDIGASENVSFELSSITINKEMPTSFMGTIAACVKEGMKSKAWLDRFQILFFAMAFVLIHFVVDIKKMYQLLFDRRWIAAGIILLFMTVNRYHGDSIAHFDDGIQPGIGSEYVYPIIGQERPIRSDEWLATTPINLSTQYLENPYGQYNNLVRATNTVNDNVITAVSILNPVSLAGILIRIVFGYEYAYSYGWYVNIFLTFLFQLELFLIISSQKKLLSVCGTCMVVLSSHYLWWGFPSFILHSSVALVCAYYFFRGESRRKKAIYAYGVSLGAALYVLNLYPAWQVPVGFYSLAVFIWIIHECRDDIKQMSKTDWGIMASAFILCVIMIASGFASKIEYMKSITDTVYPGKRVDYGGFAITKLFNYIGAVLFPYADYGNASEAGMYITLFPLPLIIALYSWLKGNRKNWLLNGLIIVSVFLGFYTTTGLPHFIAKITLMTHSTSKRCIDILGYVQVVMFVTALSDFKLENRINKKYALSLSIIMSSVAMAMANRSMKGYLGDEYRIIFWEVLLFIFFSCIAKADEKLYNLGLITIILVAVVTGMYVRPICKGTDAIYSKPVAKEIQKIATEDKGAKWIACDNNMMPQFALSCGAPVINSLNVYPNMSFWKKLDPKGYNENVYNRYAHIVITFTDGETNMEVLQDDLIRLYLGFKDIKKTEVKYVFSLRPLETDNNFVEFSEVYGEYGAYIYKVLYKQKL